MLLLRVRQGKLQFDARERLRLYYLFCSGDVWTCLFFFLTFHFVETSRPPSNSL